MTVAAVWLVGATVLTLGLWSCGPWWRVIGGCLLWPLVPVIAAVSKARHAWRRAREPQPT